MAIGTQSLNNTVYYDVCNSQAEFDAMMGYRSVNCTLVAAFSQPRAVIAEILDVSNGGLQANTRGVFTGTVFVLISKKNA